MESGGLITYPEKTLLSAMEIIVGGRGHRDQEEVLTEERDLQVWPFLMEN